MTSLGMKTSVWSATHVRLLCQKTWEFHTWILSFNYAVYMPLDQDEIERSNSFPRFRWELDLGKFLLYTHPLSIVRTWIGKIIRYVRKLHNQHLTAANDRARNGLSYELLKVKSRC